MRNKNLNNIFKLTSIIVVLFSIVILGFTNIFKIKNIENNQSIPITFKNKKTTLDKDDIEFIYEKTFDSIIILYQHKNQISNLMGEFMFGDLETDYFSEVDRDKYFLEPQVFYYPEDNGIYLEYGGMREDVSDNDWGAMTAYSFYHYHNYEGDFYSTSPLKFSPSYSSFDGKVKWLDSETIFIPGYFVWSGMYPFGGMSYLKFNGNGLVEVPIRLQSSGPVIRTSENSIVLKDGFYNTYYVDFSKLFAQGAAWNYEENSSTTGGVYEGLYCSVSGTNWDDLASTEEDNIFYLGDRVLNYNLPMYPRETTREEYESGNYSWEKYEAPSIEDLVFFYEFGDQMVKFVLGSSGLMAIREEIIFTIIDAIVFWFFGGIGELIWSSIWYGVGFILDSIGKDDYKRGIGTISQEELNQLALNGFKNSVLNNFNNLSVLRQNELISNIVLMFSAQQINAYYYEITNSDDFNVDITYDEHGIVWNSTANGDETTMYFNSDSGSFSYEDDDFILPTDDGSNNSNWWIWVSAALIIILLITIVVMTSYYFKRKK